MFTFFSAELLHLKSFNQNLNNYIFVLVIFYLHLNIIDLEQRQVKIKNGIDLQCIYKTC